MNFKFTFLILLVLITISCVRNNPIGNSNTSENFEIISFSGDKIQDQNNPAEYVYTQKVSWIASGLEYPKFACRLIMTDDELPVGISTDDDGWIYHTTDDSINSIWTEDTDFEVSFHSIMGEFKHIISEFQIKYLSDGVESDIFSKHFLRDREIGTIISTTGGNIDGQTCGTALHLLVNENILDIFVEGLYADHFEYRLNVISEDDSTIIEAGEWYNSLYCENIHEIFLSSSSEPALTPNNEGELTQFEAYVVTRNGYSDEDNTVSITFKVQEGFYPGSIIYYGDEDNDGGEGNDIWVLGENHYVNNHDLSIDFEIPYCMTEEGPHYSTPFWLDKDGNYAAINSTDMEIYLHWGWHGEFGITDHPHDEKINIVVDEQTDINYFAEIMYFDLRLDNEPYEHPSLPAAEYNFTDNDGTEWLRVPIEHEISQHTVLSDLVTGEHVFTVRVVDSQNAVDETPAEFHFLLVDPVPAEEKSGIIILDDDDNHLLFAPDDLIDEFYLEILSDYSGNIEVLDRRELFETVWDPELHFGKDVFSPTDLEPYKTVIYHSDWLTIPSNIYKEVEVLDIYMDRGGNLVLSGGENLKSSADILAECSNTFMNYFGLPMDNENCMHLVTYDENYASYLHLTFFIQAIADDGFSNNIDLALPSFCDLVNWTEGFGPVVYFENFDDDAETIFRYGCRDPIDDEDDIDEFPSQAQYDEFNLKPVALKKLGANNKCYLFGFPLSYMESEDVRSTINQIIEEIE